MTVTCWSVTAYEWIDLMEPCDIQTVREIRKEDDGRKRTWTVRFVNGVPLSGEDGALRANWLELTVTDLEGRQTCCNCRVTDIEADVLNAIGLAACGRSRWVIENGKNNTLKTKGYHLNHNFGHGGQHLANTLASCRDAVANRITFPRMYSCESTTVQRKRAML